MTVSPGRHIYLAAPFFKDEQREVCDYIERFNGMHDIIIYSPRLDGGVLSPESPVDEISATYRENCVQIENAQFVLAVVDDFDPGTIWEMGYAEARGKPILSYSDVPGRGINVMLAGCSDLGFVNGRHQLGNLMSAYQGWNWAAFPRNTWSGEIQ